MYRFLVDDYYHFDAVSRSFLSTNLLSDVDIELAIPLTLARVSRASGISCSTIGRAWDYNSQTCVRAKPSSCLSKAEHQYRSPYALKHISIHAGSLESHFLPGCAGDLEPIERSGGMGEDFDHREAFTGREREWLEGEKALAGIEVRDM